MKKSFIIIPAIAIVLIGAGIWQSQHVITPLPEPEIQNQNESANENQNSAESENDKNQNTQDSIDNFEKCVAAGKEVVGEAPHRRCIVNDDLAYIEIETCGTPNGEKMSLFEAQRIFDISQCSREGSAKDSYRCDEQNGTLEIDILAYRKDCIAVCVIDIASKTAEVEWRCDE